MSNLQWSLDLTNRLGPGQLFIEARFSLNPIFYEVKKTFEVKTDSLNLDDSLKPNSLNPASTV